MMNKFSICFTAGLLLLLSDLKAQFVLSGEFRPRTELSRGYKFLAVPDQEMSIATTQRTRLNALFHMDGLHTKLTLQDVRYWGSQPQLVANEDYAASVHEAWAEVTLFQNVGVRAGRQELVYDDHRIFGNVGWVQQARSHDLLLFKYEKDLKLHMGIAHHENSNISDNLYHGPDAYKDMQFIWGNKSWGSASISLLFLNNGVPVYTDTNVQETWYSQTYGGRFVYNHDKVALAANFYRQSGKHYTERNIGATNFLIEGTLPIGLTAGYEFLSGNDYDENDKVHAFEPFYGTNHKFNGHMDYFYVGNHINSVGLHDIYLKYNHMIKAANLFVDVHYFAADGNLPGTSDKYLGTEIDLGLNLAIHQMATLSAGWSGMFAGENMELLKQGDHKAGQHWGYLMLTVIPSFIN